MAEHDALLKQKLGQKLSSRQIQLMHLIALPVTELEQRIKQEIEENPALEEGFPPEEQQHQEENDTDEAAISEAEMILGDYSDMDDVPDTKLQHIERNATPGVEIPFSEEISLNDYLLEQLSFSPLSPEEKEIGAFIIGSLDENGFLRRDTEGLLDDLAIYQSIYTTTKDIDKVVSVLQSFDPAGIAARDLRECLLLQLQHRPHNSTVELASQILENHFNLFTHKWYDKLQTALNIRPEELRHAIQLITRLNPSPGLDFTSRLDDTLQTIIPDFYFREYDGVPVVYLNQANTPAVRVDETFTQQMQAEAKKRANTSEAGKAAALFVRQKIDDAHWFVEMIKQRNNTLLDTMSAIVDIQRDYFLSGDTHLLHPMILKDVADRTGYSISTVSRVTSTKHVQTDFGIFPLRHFFSESAKTDAGEEITTRRVREVLKQIIDQEDKKHPLSDELLVKRLKQKGLTVARRTVAKYRDMMGIPVARLRKEV